MRPQTLKNLKSLLGEKPTEPKTWEQLKDEEDLELLKRYPQCPRNVSLREFYQGSKPDKPSLFSESILHDLGD